MNDNETHGGLLKAALSSVQPLYILPGDPVAKDVLIPALSASSSLDVMMGYFSSASFAEIAPGLASFLRNSHAPIRMVISPFLTNADFDTLTKDDNELLRLAEQLIFDNVPDEDQLARHTLECLAWLITQERLLIKIAVMLNHGAIFHPKVWLFSDGHDRVALHGSSNFTGRGLSENIEQLTLSREWKGEDARDTVGRFVKMFDDLWSGDNKDCRVLQLSSAIEQRIVERYKTKDMPDDPPPPPPLPRPVPPHETKLKIPPYLVYDRGDFAHQGQAVDSWFKANHRGILEMATGSGKTITSMICATKLQDEVGKLLVIVSAPYRPLIEQWCSEIKEFGVNPINLTEAGGPDARDREIKQAVRRLRIGGSTAEVLVVSNSTLCTEKFIESLNDIDEPKMLIADECHNLGAESFVSNPPNCFEYRLGLSATPIRQYDQEGSDKLIEFFGDISFSFTLKEAIGKCLTEYDYHVHLVELTNDEMEKWRDLSDKIKSLSWKKKSVQSDPYLDNLLRQRRLILETASGKLSILENLIDDEGARNLKYALIYTTDKQPEQLELVNKSLGDRSVIYRQLTSEETKSRDQTRKILSAFQNGDLQVLTAKRVLDEGVNIPQIKLAFILASTTVERQWIQRRGRLLRMCKEIGKTHAVIHDFIVLPSGTSSAKIEELDPDERKLVRSEAKRMFEFAKLSRNAAKKGGSYEMVKYLQELADESPKS